MVLSFRTCFFSQEAFLELRKQYDDPQLVHRSVNKRVYVHAVGIQSEKLSSPGYSIAILLLDTMA